MSSSITIPVNFDDSDLDSTANELVAEIDLKCFQLGLRHWWTRRSQSYLHCSEPKPYHWLAL